MKLHLSLFFYCVCRLFPIHPVAVGRSNLVLLFCRVLSDSLFCFILTLFFSLLTPLRTAEISLSPNYTSDRAENRSDLTRLDLDSICNSTATGDRCVYRQEQNFPSVFLKNYLRLF